MNVNPDDPHNTSYTGYTFAVLEKIAERVKFQIDVVTLEQYGKRRQEISDAPYDDMVRILAEGVSLSKHGNIETFH